MKNSTSLLLLCVVLGLSSTAQKFTLLPQVGVENSNTSLQFNNLPSFSPKDMQLSPRLGLRMDYAFKKIGGPYLGIATSRSSVAVNFTNPEAGMYVSNVSAGALQLRLEGGYQFSSKPIYFNKSGAAKKSAAIAAQKAALLRSSMSGRGSCSRYRGGEYKSAMSRIAAAPAEKGWYVSVQPSLGLAYLPSVKSTVNTQIIDSKPVINYIAGNMSTAIVAGTGFEFGENADRKFNVSIQYVKGIGNLDTRSVSTLSGSKTTTTNLGSSVSGWNVSLGIPISLSKKKVVVKQPPVFKERKMNKPHGGCGQYSKLFKSI